jgi:predicted phage gp36 major capsid-like protein
MTLALALRMGPWLAILVLLGALAFQTDRAGDWKERATSCQKLRTAEHEAYRSAQREAAEKNKATVDRIEREQDEKSHAIQSRWDADRARLAELMRNNRNTPAKGAAGQSEAGPIPPAAGGSDGSQVCIPEGDALSSAENELRLFYLQEWIREQLRVAR